VSRTREISVSCILRPTAFPFFLSSTQKRKPPLRFRSAPLVSPPSLSLHAASARRPKSAHRPRQAPRLHGPPLQQVTLQTPSFSVFLFLDPSVLARLISAVRGYIFSSFWDFFPLNRIGKESLKEGDHIYSWRTAWVYAHHGAFLCLLFAPLFSYFWLMIGSDWFG
jgi:hypothetical protein